LAPKSRLSPCRLKTQSTKTEHHTPARLKTQSTKPTHRLDADPDHGVSDKSAECPPTRSACPQVARRSNDKVGVFQTSTIAPTRDTHYSWCDSAIFGGLASAARFVRAKIASRIRSAALSSRPRGDHDGALERVPAARAAATAMPMRCTAAERPCIARAESDRLRKRFLVDHFVLRAR